MTNDLKAAFEQMAERGTRRGASRVVGQALEDFTAGAQHSRRRPMVAAVALAAAAVLVVGALVVRSRVPDVERVFIDDAVLDRSDAPDVRTVLVVGTDRRVGATSPVRADTVMLVRVDRRTGSLSVLSLPRDLYVPIAGSGQRERLTAAFGMGPNTLAETVRSLTGVAFDHYVEFDFAAFTRLVVSAGGVDLFVPARARDQLAGLDLAAGCNHLDGATALAYARSRHLETQDGPGGRFVADPTGDLGRIARQHHLVVVAIEQVARTRDPRRVERIARAVDDNVRVDEGFSLRDTVAFAKDWAETVGSVEMLVYPATPRSLANGAAVLQPDADRAAGVVAQFIEADDAEPRSSGDATC